MQEEERLIASPGQIKAYHRISSELETFYNEINALSKKKPNDPLNKFKINFLNQSLVKANDLLGDAFKPFPDFVTFDVEGSMPSASDAVLVIAHYQKSLGRFRARHSNTDRHHGTTWNQLEDTEEPDFDIDDLDDSFDAITETLIHDGNGEEKDEK